MGRKIPRWRIGAERELAKILWDLGYVVCRCPASGGSRKAYPCLDLFVWNPGNGELWAVEVKTTTKEDADVKYAVSLLSKDEKEKIQRLRKRGVKIAIALRKNGKWKMWELGDNCEPISELVGERPL